MNLLAFPRGGQIRPEDIQPPLTIAVRPLSRWCFVRESRQGVRPENWLAVTGFEHTSLCHSSPIVGLMRSGNDLLISDETGDLFRLQGPPARRADLAKLELVFQFLEKSGPIEILSVIRDDVEILALRCSAPIRLWLENSLGETP